MPDMTKLQHQIIQTALKYCVQYHTETTPISNIKWTIVTDPARRQTRTKPTPIIQTCAVHLKSIFNSWCLSSNDWF